MKNFRVGFSILTCLTLINCQSNIKIKNQFEFPSIWYTDNFLLFLLNLINRKGEFLSALIFILNAVVHFVLFEDGSLRELRQLLFQ